MPDTYLLVSDSMYMYVRLNDACLSIERSERKLILSIITFYERKENMALFCELIVLISYGRNI